MTRTLERTAAPVRRGDRVEVREAGIRPWTGTVLSVKWSSVSGWWVEVLDDPRGVWIIRAADVVRIDEEDEEAVRVSYPNTAAMDAALASGGDA